MYLNGMGDYYDDLLAAAVDPGGYNATPAVTATPVPASGDSFGLNTWAPLISQGIAVWGQVSKAQNDAEIAKLYAARGIAPPGYSTPYAANRPVAYAGTARAAGSSPFPGSGQSGTLFGIDVTTLILIAAIGAAAYIYSQR